MFDFIVSLMNKFEAEIDNKKKYNTKTFVCDSLVKNCVEVLKCFYVEDETTLYLKPIKIIGQIFQIDYEDIDKKKYNLVRMKHHLECIMYFTKYIDAHVIWEDFLLYPTVYEPMFNNIIENYKLNEIDSKNEFLKLYEKKFPMPDIPKLPPPILLEIPKE